MNDTKIAMIHPGEILMQEFLEPMGISQYRLAKEKLADRLETEVVIHDH